MDIAIDSSFHLPNSSFVFIYDSMLEEGNFRKKYCIKKDRTKIDSVLLIYGGHPSMYDSLLAKLLSKYNVDFKEIAATSRHKIIHQQVSIATDTTLSMSKMIGTISFSQPIIEGKTALIYFEAIDPSHLEFGFGDLLIFENSGSGWLLSATYNLWILNGYEKI